MSGWTTDQMPSQADRRAVITGANSGLGYEAALALARAGAEVVLAVRDRARGDDAAARIRAEAPDALVRVQTLDLASLESVRNCADELASAGPINLLINNAGVMATPLRRTADGFELQLGTNHLGHFALTGLLLPVLGEPGSRVVTVSSIAHRDGHIDLNNLNADHGYSAWGAYQQAKLANLMYAIELQRRLEEAGHPLLSVAAHPGLASTNLLVADANLPGGRIGRLVAKAGWSLFTQSAAKGALPILYAATMPDVRGGEYFGPRGPHEAWGAPKRATVAPRAREASTAQALWTESERLTGVRYQLGDQA